MARCLGWAQSGTLRVEGTEYATSCMVRYAVISRSTVMNSSPAHLRTCPKVPRVSASSFNSCANDKPCLSNPPNTESPIHISTIFGHTCWAQYSKVGEFLTRVLYFTLNSNYPSICTVLRTTNTIQLRCTVLPCLPMQESTRRDRFLCKCTLRAYVNPLEMAHKARLAPMAAPFADVVVSWHS